MKTQISALVEVTVREVNDGVEETGLAYSTRPPGGGARPEIHLRFRPCPSSNPRSLKSGGRGGEKINLSPGLIRGTVVTPVSLGLILPKVKWAWAGSGILEEVIHMSHA